MKLFKRKQKTNEEIGKAKVEVPIKSNNKGTFTDPRDGHTYKIVKIGNKIWMAENLAYKANSGCWVYANDESNVDEYGYLYDWETAQKICPTGWRLPTKEDFQTILDNFDDDSEAYKAIIPGGSSGLSIPFGHWHDMDPNADTEGNYAYYWSSSEGDTNCAWNLDIDGENKITYMDYTKNTSQGFSVRCLKDS